LGAFTAQILADTGIKPASSPEALREVV